MRFSAKNVASKGSYFSGRKITSNDLKKKTLAYGQAKREFEKLKKSPKGKKIADKDKYRKSYNAMKNARDDLEQAIYDKTKYDSMNITAGTVGGIGAAGLLGRHLYKRYQNANSLKTKAKKVFKDYGVPALGVGTISGLAYLGTDKLAGEKMNAKQKANIVVRSGEVGVNDAMKSAKTSAEKKAILKALRENKMQKMAYARNNNSSFTSERAIYDMDDDTLKRRLAYEKGETGMRSLMGGGAGALLGGLHGSAFGGKGALIGTGIGAALGAGGGYLTSKLRELEAAREYKRRKNFKRRQEDGKMKKTANRKLLAAGAGLGALGGLAGYSASDKGAAGRGTAAGVVGGGIGGALGALGGGAAGGLLTAKGLLAALKRTDPKMYKRLQREARYNPNTAKFMEKLKRKFTGPDKEAKTRLKALATLTAMGGGIGAAGGLLSGTVAGGAFGGATAGRRDASKQKMTSVKRSRKYEDYK